jgi:hypothetical protein
MRTLKSCRFYRGRIWFLFLTPNQKVALLVAPFFEGWLKFSLFKNYGLDNQGKTLN